VALREPAPLTHAALVMANLARGAASNAYEAVRHSDRDLARNLAPFFIATW
jgi:hypothetical protein